MLAHYLFLVSTLTLSALAAPQHYDPPSFPGHKCLNNTDADQIGFLWRELIGNYSKTTADAALAPNYTDYSASALTLNSVCLQAPGPKINPLDPIFTNRSIFELAQGSQPALPTNEFQIWHSCSEVTMRYDICIKGNCTIPVLAIIAIETVPAPSNNTYPFQIATTYSEFDSEAWIKNLQNSGDCVDPSTVPPPSE